jgi:hypothetical protein
MFYNPSSHSTSSRKSNIISLDKPAKVATPPVSQASAYNTEASSAEKAITRTTSERTTRRERSPTTKDGFGFDAYVYKHKLDKEVTPRKQVTRSGDDGSRTVGGGGVGVDVDNETYFTPTELKMLLLNFENLSSEEQLNLTEYLQRHGGTDTQREDSRAPMNAASCAAPLAALPDAPLATYSVPPPSYGGSATFARQPDPLESIFSR